jgi:hypothetical protein
MLLSVGLITGLVGCGGSSTNVQNQPAPAATASVSIAFQPAPPTSISLLVTTKLTAVVTNDPSSEGVDWAVLCSNPTASTNQCGSLSSSHTASGVATVYTPNLAPGANTQSITIEAFATADHTKNVVASFNVTGFAGVLKGTYVFSTKGTDNNGIYQLAGVIVFDGKGGITGGEQTHNDNILSVTDTITGGSYTVGPDGRGTLTINTTDQNIGQLGIENLSFVFISSSQALIQTLDNVSGSNPLPPSVESSSGTLELQTSTSAPTGGYAFVVSGYDGNSQSMAIGGVLNIDSPNTISGVGSVADQYDATVLTASSTISGTQTKPDAYGSFKFNLTTGFATAALQLTGYIVDSTHIKLIESDNSGPGTGGVTSGVAVSQGAARGTFTTNSAFAGSYVFDILGQDSTGVPTTLAGVGQFMADSNGNLNSGYEDEVLSAVSPTLVISDSFTGTYALDPSGTGRVDSSITFSSSGPGPELIFYLTGNGNAPLILDADDNSSAATVGSVGVGAAHPQAAATFSFNGLYGLKFIQSSATTVNTGTGPFTVSGAAGTLAGTVDLNLQFNANSAVPFTGTFGAFSSSGRSIGTLNNPNFFTSNNMIAVAFYAADANHVFVIETDSATTGVLSFGYFVTRSPVCPTCP